MIAKCRHCDKIRLIYYGLCTRCNCKPKDLYRLLKRNLNLKAKIETLKKRAGEKHRLLNNIRGKFYNLQKVCRRTTRALYEIDAAHPALCKPYLPKPKGRPSLQKQKISAVDSRSFLDDKNDPQRSQDLPAI